VVRTTMRWAVAVAFMALALAGAGVAGDDDAEASHGRYFNLSWRSVGPDTADFKLTTAWRRSTWGGTDTDGRPKIGDTFTEAALNYGDGRSSGSLR
jgi:hypothetical protein